MLFQCHVERIIQDRISMTAKISTSSHWQNIKEGEKQKRQNSEWTQRFVSFPMDIYFILLIPILLLKGSGSVWFSHKMTLKTQTKIQVDW